MIIYYLKNEVNILCKKNIKPLYNVWYMLLNIKISNYFSMLLSKDNLAFVEKTVNLINQNQNNDT